ncbi:ABC transporter ATP-binding protein [Ferrimicrobium acidiphilum]|jgi:branched-chain amino acid transport system ATP-binding protein|uniref:ABC transporter ATP-binding protein n=1 Tax=Ferrimicrobium acidiphilum TaxID=121039 RepID=UPI0023F2E86D|nr:ATP-binding cassette domain-containing protein [Ferrimicrobium acidiphilum]MCL5052952.1 ATP-binding cassette domain-containing protein [Gammaproteobacteria bacterium]
MSENVIEVHNLAQSFGGLRAVDGVSFSLANGEVLGLVGPNGSGKTTIINTICGLYEPTGGSVMLDGKDVTGLRADKLARIGINRTFQIPRPFLDLTVFENLEIARNHASRVTLGVAEVAELVGLSESMGKPASSLNSTHKKMLDLGRALVMSPRVLFVDELAAGLMPAELEGVTQLLREIARDRSVVVVEHLLGFLDRVADRVLVLNAGKEIFAGSLSAALQDDLVKKVFLGGSSSS